MTDTRTRRYIVEVTADMLLIPSDGIEAADELMDALASATLPGVGIQC